MPKQIIKDTDGLKRFLHIISNLNLDKVWQLEWKEYVKSRSAEQNSLMWMWNAIMGGEIGCTKDDAHEYIMRELLVPKIKEVKGKIIETYSTKGMNVKEMTNYLNMYHTWAGADMGVNLPLPSDMHYR